MRVLIDARYLDSAYSGIGTYSRLLIEHLAKVDDQTEYQVLVGKGFRDSLSVGTNFEVLSWGPKPVSWKTYFRMHDALETLKPDVVHCLAPPAPVLYNGPLMITLHDLQPFNDPEFSGRRFGPVRTGYNLFYSWAYPTVINQAKWVLCDSNSTREDLLRLMPEMVAKSIVVSPGLEPPVGEDVTEGQIESVRAKFGLHERYCLYYGSTRPNKNLVKLVEAFQLERSFPTKVLQRYESRFDLHQYPRVREGGALYRTGRVVLIEPTRWKVYREGNISVLQMSERQHGKRERISDAAHLDDAFFDLPPDVRASSPDEVDTVIFCDYGASKDGLYVRKDGEPGPAFAAHQRFAILHVYDAHSGDLIGRHVLRGTASPDETSALGKHSGSMPEVAEYVADMPLRR